MVTRKPLGLPPDIARPFREDMKAYFAEEDAIKRDAIAARSIVFARHAVSAGASPSVALAEPPLSSDAKRLGAKLRCTERRSRSN
jgi:hypothetical protein